MAGLVVLVIAVVWLAFEAVKGPETSGQFPTAPTATAYARSFQATVSAADTAQARPAQQAATPQPAAPAAAPPAVAAPTTATGPIAAPTTGTAGTPQVGGAVTGLTPQPAATAEVAQAAVAETPAPLQSASASQAEPAATATASGGSGESATATSLPTVPPELDAQVSDAYSHYWQVKADAFLALDGSALSQVAAGPELGRLQAHIEDEQAAGRATRVNIQHRFVVFSASDSQAQVADDYHDFSIWVDPTTHEPLPGQSEPSSIDAAPELKLVYELELVDGVWKANDAVQVVGNGGTQ